MKRVLLASVLVFVFVFLLASCSDEDDMPCDANGDGVLQSHEKQACIAQQQDGSGDDGLSGSDGETRERVSEDLTGFIGIHLEVQDDLTGHSYEEEYWPVLVDLVALADSYDVKLTLKFVPQWASYILADEEKLELVRSWEENGHELAVHHHGPSHAHWDGYTNNEAYFDDPNFLGTVEDMMELLNQLPASGQMLTSGQTDEETDWPNGVIYETEGYLQERCCLVSEPHPSEDGTPGVTELNTMGYTIDKHETIEVTLEDIEDAILEAEEGEYLGITLSDIGFDKERDAVEELFILLQDYDVEIIALKDILSDYS